MPRSRIPVLFEEGNDDGRELPWKWSLCGSCDGHGTDRGASVECDGGGFTSSEWAEQDDDFKQDYLSGFYDRPCPHCEDGKVRVVNKAQMTKADIKAYHKQCEDDAEIESIYRMERRMGA